MQSPEIRLGCNTNSYILLYDIFDAVKIIKDSGIRFLEISSERELTQVLYNRYPNEFRSYYDKLRNCIDKNKQKVITTCSWVRDNSWVTADKKYVKKAGISMLYSFIDMARILKAERMMSPFGTVRGPLDMSDKEIKISINNGIESWVDASQYAAITNEFGHPIKTIEIEQMSYLRDPPATIGQARQIFNEARRLQKESDIPYIPIFLRYDVAHAPSKKESTNEDDFNAMGWLRAFPTDITAFHLKGYKDEEGRPVVPIAEEYADRGRDITYNLINTIESLNELRIKAGAPVLETVDVVIEGIMLKERDSERKKIEKANAETIKNVKSFFKERNYEENSKTGLLVKKSFF